MEEICQAVWGNSKLIYMIISWPQSCKGRKNINVSCLGNDALT